MVNTVIYYKSTLLVMGLTRLPYGVCWSAQLPEKAIFFEA